MKITRAGGLLTMLPFMLLWLTHRVEEWQSNNDTIGKIERLHRLKEKGIITEEEFEKMKSELMYKL